MCLPYFHDIPTGIFCLLVCCVSLNVLLGNDFKDSIGGMIDSAYTFSFQGFSDEMDYWVDADGELAIWYKALGSTYLWFIGPLPYLGSNVAAIYSASNTLEKKCPNNEGYVWNWKYDNNFYISSGFSDTNDFYIKCANEDDFCTSQNPCGTDQGDCDTHDECQDDLSCGSNNCPDYLGFHSEFDCCYVPTVGDEHFCTNANPCAVNEGDCDSNNQCKTNLFCDPTSSCLAYLGFTSGVNCCSTGSQCKIHEITLKQKRFTRTL